MPWGLRWLRPSGRTSGKPTGTNFGLKPASPHGAALSYTVRNEDYRKAGLRVGCLGMGQLNVPARGDREFSGFMKPDIAVVPWFDSECTCGLGF